MSKHRSRFLIGLVVLAALSGTAGVAFGVASTTDTGLFAVFERQAAPSDRLPAAMAANMEAANAETPPGLAGELAEGKLLPARSRLVLGDVGSRGMSLYAVPTTKGRACWVIRGAGGGCARATEPVSWGMLLPPSGVAGNAVFGGLVRNDVRNVEVVVAGTREPTTFGSNGFFYEAHDGRLPTALVLSFRNGSTQTIAVRDPRP